MIECVINFHFNIYKEMRVKCDKEQWYDHVPKSFETSREGKVTIFCNQKLQNNRTLPSTKSNFIIRDNNQDTRMFIDVAIPGERNEEAEKILKYNDFIIEMQRTWNVIENRIPVITGRLEPFLNPSDFT